MTYHPQRRKGIMLCYPFEEKRLAKWKPPYLVQPKLDGDRCRNAPINNMPFLLTSEENPFFSVPHINEQLLAKGNHRLPFDGELYNHDIHAEGGHDLIHSICSRTTNLHPRYKEMEFHVFDLKLPKTPQMERTTILNHLRNDLGSNIKMVPFWICETLGDITKVYDEIIEKKYEGIVIRHMDAPYIDRKSIYMMKFKPKKHDIYKIIDWIEEVSVDGVPKGRVGSLCCTSGEEVFYVGSWALTDDQREELWKIKDTLPGKLVKVGYQHTSPGRGVPLSSVFMEIVEEGGEEGAAGS